MKIKAKLLDKSTIVSPSWLLYNDEERLIEELVCSGCPNRDNTLPESYEPMCYGECIEDFVEKIGEAEIRFEVIR